MMRETRGNDERDQGVVVLGVMMRETRGNDERDQE